MAAHSLYSDTIPKDLLDMHYQRLKHQKLYTPNEILQVMDILGGFESTLAVLLRSEEMQMNQTQHSEMTKVIQCFDDHYTNHSGTLISADTNDVKAELESDLSMKTEKWTHYFSKTDTLIHALLSKSKINILFAVFRFQTSFYILLGCVILLCSMCALSEFFPWTDSYLLILIRITLLFWLAMNAIYSLLSSNKRGLRLLIGCFEFWIKLFYGIQLSVCKFILFYLKTDYIQQKKNTINTDSDYLILTDLILRVILVVFVVLWVVTLDSRNGGKNMQIKTRNRLFVLITLAICYTGFAVHNFFKLYLCDRDRSIINIGSINEEMIVSISLLTLISSSYELLAVFLWKQVYCACRNIMKKNRNKCTVIKYTPYVQWIENDTNDYISEHSSTDDNNNNENIDFIDMRNVKTKACAESEEMSSISSEFQISLA